MTRVFSIFCVCMHALHQSGQGQADTGTGFLCIIETISSWSPCRHAT